MDKYEMASKLQELLDKAELAQEKMIDVEGYEGKYAACRNGDVWSYWANGALNASDNGQGYLYVALHKNGKRKMFRVNRLIAEAFIPKPDWWTPGMKLDVGHKNDCRWDNRVENLYWCTRKENLDTDHYRAARTYYGPTPIRCVETGVEYPTQKAAAVDLGIHPKSISNVINGYQHTAGGYHWEKIVVEENEE